MCLIAFAHDIGDHVLAIAANRDEDYGRETLPAHFWSDLPEVYGGRDAVAGGTWLGISTHGRLAAVTNVRTRSATRGQKSRGALCRDFLAGNERAATYALTALRNRADYGPFNLLVHDGSSLMYVGHTTEAPVPVERGVHALSNAALNDPWPKVEQTRRALLELAGGARPDLVEAMFALLATREAADDHLLPDTGYGLEVERRLAPVFIVSPTYGTRSSTVVLWRRDGHITFEERSFGQGGEPMGTVRKAFSVSTNGTRSHLPNGG